MNDLLHSKQLVRNNWTTMSILLFYVMLKTFKLWFVQPEYY